MLPDCHPKFKEFCGVFSKNNISGTASPGELFFFRTQEGKLCGSVPDLVWLKWLAGKIPSALGAHRIELELPDGWLQIINGRVAKVSHINVDVQITGHVITFSGSVQQHVLMTTSDILRNKAVFAMMSDKSRTLIMLTTGHHYTY